MIVVRYFARVRESLGRDQESVPMPEGHCCIDDVLRVLRDRDPQAWAKLPAGMSLLFAVNQQMAPADTEIHDGDELAVFPPVTGG